MDFLLGGFIDVKYSDGGHEYIDASSVADIASSEIGEDFCTIILKSDRRMLIPASVAEVRRQISEIRARGQKTLRALLK